MNKERFRSGLLRFAKVINQANAADSLPLAEPCWASPKRSPKRLRPRLPETPTTSESIDVGIAHDLCSRRGNRLAKSLLQDKQAFSAARSLSAALMKPRVMAIATMAAVMNTAPVPKTNE